MTDSDVPTPGEEGPSILPTSLNSEFKSFAGQLYVPKLSTGQVIVFLALVVVLIGLDLGVSAIEIREIEPPLHGAVTVPASWWTRITLWLGVASFAAYLVASVILIHSRCFRMLGRLQPGHWIVLILATAGVLGRIANQLDLLRFTHHLPHGWARPASEAMSWLNLLTVGGLFVFAAVRLQDAKRWKVLLAFGSANASVFYLPVVLTPFFPRAVSAFVQVWQWSLPWWSAIFVMIALVAVIFDWPRRATRDWVHWLGVSLWTLGGLAYLLTYLHTMMAWLAKH